MRGGMTEFIARIEQEAFEVARGVDEGGGDGHGGEALITSSMIGYSSNSLAYITEPPSKAALLQHLRPKGSRSELLQGSFLGLRQKLALDHVATLDVPQAYVQLQSIEP
jgi:hypothetical protein